MLFRQIDDPKLAQYAYLIGCQRTGEALIIDPERDVDRYVTLAQAEGLRITAVAETHIHADFLSGARELAEELGVKLYLSDEGPDDWKYEWARDGDYDVRWLHDGDSFSIGKIEIQALHTPGHTPEHMSFLVTDHGSGASQPIGIASGDFVFVGDLGRPDLLESAAGIAGQMDPSARILYRSVERFLALPDFVQVWPGHGAGSACGKALGAVPSSTVGYERRHNPAIASTSAGEDAFVEAILEGQQEPPLYFATMKRLNKVGAPVLGGLPEAEHLNDTELRRAIEDRQVVVVDTRRDRQFFMQTHLEGSIHAPLDRAFPTIVGSYLSAEQDIVLIVEDEHSVEEATRDLVRIGFDRIRGFALSSTLQAPEIVDLLRATRVIDFEALEQERDRADTTVLDVRGASEFAENHVSGAHNVAHTRLLDRLDEIPDDGELLVYCRTGSRAAAATSFLEKAGRSVTLVDDEITSWRERAA